MKKNIKYDCKYDEFCNFIVPSKKMIPDWYKKTPSWSTGTRLEAGKLTEKSFKQCLPFLDSLSSGYMILTAADLFVHQTPNGPRVEWTNEYNQLIETRQVSWNQALPVPMGCHNTQFLWTTIHCLQVPKGYSVMITHPLNRFDLPFVTLSGIFDGDFVMYANGNLPFYMSSTFEGVIPQGTPIAQVIPFKTDSWKMERDVKLYEIGEMYRRQSFSKFIGWYKNTFWQKKYFE